MQFIFERRKDLNSWSFQAISGYYIYQLSEVHKFQFRFSYYYLNIDHYNFSNWKILLVDACYLVQ